MKYRREIDGLRALAVLPVILFHAGFNMFSGGFVGVDVFFVISGYLITTIIVSELERGKFSIVNFYERRARRILPALFLVMLCSIPFAWFWLRAHDMKDFFESLFAVSLFLSNILFWSESGYFDTATELKPLLHTWSLAVEEQYYILFPFLMMFFWRHGKHWIFIVLTIICITSFVFAQWASIANPSMAFYLLPTRTWELMIGAFSAFFLLQNNRVKFTSNVSETGGWLGLALILFSVFSYSKATPFPGFYALIPTIGTALIILFATQQTTIGKFIGNKIFVSIGLISYSAYLWHQPLFVFARNISYNEPSNIVFIILTLASIVLAYFTWKYIETPFRVKSKFSRKFIFLFSAFGMAIFISIGIFGHLNKGFPKTTDIKKAFTEKHRINDDFIVLGDSHASHLISGLSSITSGNITDYTGSGCIPFRNVDRYDYRFKPGACAKKINGHLDQIIAKNPKATIILSSMGPVYIDGKPFNNKDYARVTGLGVELITDKSIKNRGKVFEIGLRTTLAELSQLKNAVIVVAIDIPELGIDYGCSKQEKEAVLFGSKFGDFVKNPITDECFVSRKNYNERSRAYKSIINTVTSEFSKVRVFDPTEFFCDKNKCKGFNPEYGFLYHDFDHLSNAGSLFYTSKLVDFLKPSNPKVL